MTHSASLQNVLVPMPPVVDGTLYSSSTPRQHNQALSGTTETEAFAQVFAREESLALAIAGGNPAQPVSIERIPSHSVDAEPQEGIDTADISVNHAQFPLEAAFKHLPHEEPLTDLDWQTITSLPDHHEQSRAIHQTGGNSISDMAENPIAPLLSVLVEGLMQPMGQPSFDVLLTDTAHTTVSLKPGDAITRGASLQSHPSVPEAMLVPVASDDPSVIVGASKGFDIRSSQGPGTVTYAPPDIADLLPIEPIPAPGPSGAPPNAVTASLVRTYTQTGVGIPAVAGLPVDPLHELPLPQQAAATDQSAPDKIKSDTQPMPAYSPLNTKAVLHYTIPSVHVTVPAEANTARMEPALLVGELQAVQQLVPSAVHAAGPRLEVQDRMTAAELAAFVSGQQLGGTGRTDALVESPDPQRPELSRAALQQLLDASVRAAERPVELQLNPEELGRVRISMSITEASVTMTVLAERSETLELMRRHSDLLAQELRQLGYEMISFSFGQHGQEQEKQAENPSARSLLAADQPVVSPTINSTPGPVETGLDIRL